MSNVKIGYALPKVTPYCIKQYFFSNCLALGDFILKAISDSVLRMKDDTAPGLTNDQSSTNHMTQTEK